MPSAALQQWTTVRAISLDQIEQAHLSVGGSGRGRRYATQQINQAYVMLLSSQFQAFCRDLHTECVETLVNAITPTVIQSALRTEFLLDRKLDRGNPNPGNIGADFSRLGVRFWPRVLSIDSRNTARRNQLDSLNTWRNAIAHQDFDPARLNGRTTVQLREVRVWRSMCNNLSDGFDQVMYDYLLSVTGTLPW